MGKLDLLRPGQFQKLRDAVKDLTGIVFEDTDVEFMLRRLRPLAGRLGCADFDEFITKVQRGTSVVRNGLVDAVTTRETQWFRDASFEKLLSETLLPEAAQRAKEERRQVKIWSAAASTGQEAYSIAILLAELEGRGRLSGLPLQSFRIRGTDLSLEALATAREGYYSGVAAQRGLSEKRRAAFFDPERAGFRVKPRLRALTTFERANLTQLDAKREDWDLILLRNVLIYFTPETRGRILDSMVRKFGPQGVLMMGGSEDPQRYSKLYERKRAAGGVFFVPKGA